MNKQTGKRAWWCDACHVPILGEKCFACGKMGRDLCAATLVPVFKPEIQYLKKHIDSEIHPLLKEREIWVSPGNYTYYCQGVPILKLAATNGYVEILEQSRKLKPLGRTRKKWLMTLQQANRTYIEELQYEAEDFIRRTVKSYQDKTTMVSFSGGKDSTVTSHLVMNALGRSDVLHIFADTTIEFPDTYVYLKEFQQQHPLTPFIQSRSKLDFFQTAEAIGPPSRILRWCCSTHKTNPLSKLIDSMSPDQGVLTFDGVRRAESLRRASYSRISDKHKIAREILGSPILYWTDFDVWLYLLYHQLFFNHAYRKGFRRVGCLYCPFNSSWSQKMVKYRYNGKGEKWQTFLTLQAEKMQHPNPANFIDQGWRARAGGRGLDHYKTAIESTPCSLSDNAVMYQLLSGDIQLVHHFLRPLGPQSRVNSDKFSEIFLIHDYKSNEILASVEVGYADQAIRINYIIQKYRRLFQQRVEKQLKKLQACIYCGACGAKCKLKALDADGIFCVDDNKCVSCLSCVKHRCPAIESLMKKGKE
ncbi:MAG: phosphoadenosine phosphosulfate reductase family protein [Desulfobacula sp.]|jgi:phosphoadenosine phosphosulfate reductase|nr:phosphoadenosine phosphosulfate reductase family protein [Desulfobacula sp.]